MELVCSWGDHQPSSSAHGARGSPDPPWPYGEPRARGELGKRCDAEPRRIGAEVCSPSTVSLCRMQLLVARLVPFRRSALGVAPLAGSEGVARARANRASSGLISFLCEGEDAWSWFPNAETTRQAVVPTEPEAAQTLLGPMGSRGLGEN